MNNLPNQTVAQRTPLYGVKFSLRDEFNDARSAGSINGTLASDGINARTVIDTNSKLSISGGLLNYATGEAGNGDPGIHYPTMARVRGLTLFAKQTDTSVGSGNIGWDTDTTGTPTIGFNASNTVINVLRNAGVVLAAGTHTPGVPHYFACTLRSTGSLHFVYGGVYTSWTLLYVNPLLTTTPLYPALTNSGTTHVGSVDFIRVPTSPILFYPIASDSFDRANGALGTSNGAGTEETAKTTPVWSDKSGTSAIATNVAKFSALGSGIGISVLETNATDVLCEVVATRTAGNTGMCLRYTDASNYITCHHNGTNLQVVEVVAGTPTTLLNTAATYGAASIMTIQLRGNKIRTYYGASAVGSEVTTAVTTGTKHGIYATDTNATFNNFSAWATTSSDYSKLSQYIS